MISYYHISSSGRHRVGHRVRRIRERDRDRSKQERLLRLWSMNTGQIELILRRNIDNFDGVFSRDRLPDKPRLLVCNTDPSSRPGQHWIAIYVGEDGRGEYFDSLAARYF
jgi:hypothetical protein